MRILQIIPETEEDIEKLLKYADENRFSTAMLKLIQDGSLEGAGENPDYVLHIHDGYRVVYSLEEHPNKEKGKPGIWLRHISISVDRLKKYPQPVAVQMILKAFKMSENFEDCHSWIDKESEAINILQEYEWNSDGKGI